jgi:hypothetical protein
LENSDALFEMEEFSGSLAGGHERFNADVFVFRPNSETLETLLQVSSKVQGKA